MDPKKAEKLRPVMADKTVTIRGTRMPETPDRSPAGGGPGGRSMVPDPKPAPKRTPPPQPNRGSGSDWGRLAIGSGGCAYRSGEEFSGSGEDPYGPSALTTILTR